MRRWSWGERGVWRVKRGVWGEKGCLVAKSVFLGLKRGVGGIMGVFWGANGFFGGVWR